MKELFWVVVVVFTTIVLGHALAMQPKFKVSPVTPELEAAAKRMIQDHISKK